MSDLLTSADLPKTQQAWRKHARGVPRTVLSLDTVEVPTPKPGQVLVKISAAALNPVGHKLMGLLPHIFAKPSIPEQDVTGTVVAIRPSGHNSPTSSLGIGSRVWGLTLEGGALAEYVAIDEARVAPVPANVKTEEAAGIATVFGTAIQALEVGNVRDGQHIFVAGGSTSVGGVTIQMLKAKGCTVSASCSGKNTELVRGFGADKVYDYTKSPLHEQLKASGEQFDSIIDCVGGYDLWRNCASYTKEGSVYSNPGSALHSFSDLPSEVKGFMDTMFRPAWLGGVPKRTFKFFMLKPSTQTFTEISKYIADGRVKPTVDSVYEFSDVLSAYDRIMSGRATGKVVVRAPAQTK